MLRFENLNVADPLVLTVNQLALFVIPEVQPDGSYMPVGVIPDLEEKAFTPGPLGFGIFHKARLDLLLGLNEQGVRALSLTFIAAKACLKTRPDLRPYFLRERLDGLRLFPHLIFRPSIWG